MTSHRVIAAGPTGWLVEPHGVAPADYAAVVVAAEREGVVDVVPAAATVLVTVAPPVDQTAFVRWLRALDVPANERGLLAMVEIEVVYDGADLGEVAERVGRSVVEVVDLHTAGDYRCAFCGFAPGFGYLGGLDSALHLPRRDTPRTGVPAGSVAIADAYSAVYPSASPGGWHLIGRTDAVLWQPDRERPALLAPGTPVRFVQILP